MLSQWRGVIFCPSVVSWMRGYILSKSCFDDEVLYFVQVLCQGRGVLFDQMFCEERGAIIYTSVVSRKRYYILSNCCVKDEVLYFVKVLSKGRGIIFCQSIV